MEKPFAGYVRSCNCKSSQIACYNTGKTCYKPYGKAVPEGIAQVSETDEPVIAGQGKIPIHGLEAFYQNGQEGIDHKYYQRQGCKPY